MGCPRPCRTRALSSIACFCLLCAVLDLQILRSLCLSAFAPNLQSLARLKQAHRWIPPLSQQLCGQNHRKVAGQGPRIQYDFSRRGRWPPLLALRGVASEENEGTLDDLDIIINPEEREEREREDAVDSGSSEGRESVVPRGERSEAVEEVTRHDSWAHFVRHHAVGEWKGVESEYDITTALDPVILRLGRCIPLDKALDHKLIVTELRADSEDSKEQTGDTPRRKNTGHAEWVDEERTERDMEEQFETQTKTRVERRTLAHVCHQEASARASFHTTRGGLSELRVELAVKHADWHASSQIRFTQGVLSGVACNWACLDDFPQALSETTYKDPELQGPEGWEVVYYNDWQGMRARDVVVSEGKGGGREEKLVGEEEEIAWSGHMHEPRPMGGKETSAGPRSLYHLPQGAWITCPQDVLSCGNGADGEAEVGFGAGWVFWDEAEAEASLIARVTAWVRADTIRSWLRGDLQPGRRPPDASHSAPHKDSSAHNVVCRMAVEKFWYTEVDYPDTVDWELLRRSLEDAQRSEIRKRLLGR